MQMKEDSRKVTPSRRLIDRTAVESKDACEDVVTLGDVWRNDEGGLSYY